MVVIGFFGGDVPCVRDDYVVECMFGLEYPGVMWEG
jgi:hypothetical protein